MRNGDVFRMTSFTHVGPYMRVGMKVGDRTKVGVFMFLGEENKDGTDPLDCIKRMNELGWIIDNKKSCWSE